MVRSLCVGSWARRRPFIGHRADALQFVLHVWSATGGAWDGRASEPPPRAAKGYGGFDARFPKEAPPPPAPPTPPRPQTLYDVLGVGPDASDAHLRRSYKALALRHHPDRTETTRETTELMAKINGAYEVLCDPDARAQYDVTLLAS